MYTYEIWNKRDPINGCPAEKAIAAHNISPSEQVYLIQRDGQTTMLQTDQNSPALLNFKGKPHTINELAEKHVEMLEEAAVEAAERESEEALQVVSASVAPAE